MTIDKEFTNRFANAETIEAKTGLHGLPKPSGFAAVGDIEDIEWGGKAVEVWEGIQCDGVIDLYGLIQLIKQDIKEQAARCSSNSNGENQFALCHITVCSNKFIMISPASLANNKDKDIFAAAANEITKSICENIKAKPYLSVFCGEAWTCCIRKSFQEKIECLPEDKKSSLKNAVIEAAVEKFGGISNIPNDHPAIVKYDVLMMSFQFKSKNGSASVLCTIPLHNDPEITHEAFEILSDKVNGSRQEGRFVVDTDHYEIIRNYDKSQFKVMD